MWTALTELLMRSSSLELHTVHFILIALTTLISQQSFTRNFTRSKTAATQKKQNDSAKEKMTTPCKARTKKNQLSLIMSLCQMAREASFSFNFFCRIFMSCLHSFNVIELKIDTDIVQCLIFNNLKKIFSHNIVSFA